MATAVGLNMKITADTSGIGRGMTRTEKLLAGVDKNAQSAARSLRAIATIQVGGAVIKGLSSIVGTLTSAANAAVGYANNLRSTIDETAKLAARTGISVEALQGFQLAAELSGVQNFQEAISKLGVKLAQAGQGNKDVLATLQSIGLAFEDLERLSPEQRFKAVADAIRRLPSDLQKSAAAVKLFEEGGIQLLPLFAQNLGEIQDRAQRLGIILGRDQTAAIEQMNDSLSLVRKTFDGIIGQVTANLAPVVTALAEEFLQFVEAFEGINGAQGGNAIAEFITTTVSGGLNSFLDLIRSLGNGLLTFLDVVGRVSKKIGDFFDFDVRSEQQKSLDTQIARVSENLRILGRGGAIAQARGQDITENQRAMAVQQGLLDELVAQRNSLSGEGLIEALRKGLDRSVAAAQNANNAVAARLAARGGNAGGGGPAMAGRSLLADIADPVTAFAKQKGLQIGAFAKGMFDGVVERFREKQQQLDAIDKQITSTQLERAKRAEEIEAGRLDALSRSSTQALSVSDIRSGGISEILRIATGREDPAIEEYRKQLGELRKIDAKLGELRADRVQIIGNGARA